MKQSPNLICHVFLFSYVATPQMNVCRLQTSHKTATHNQNITAVEAAACDNYDKHTDATYRHVSAMYIVVCERLTAELDYVL